MNGEQRTEKRVPSRPAGVLFGLAAERKRFGFELCNVQRHNFRLMLDSLRSRTYFTGFGLSAPHNVSDFNWVCHDVVIHLQSGPRLRGK